MKRRATAGGKVPKARRRKAQNVPAAIGSRRRSDAILREQLDQSRRELTEALEHQAATSEVLDLISRTPTDAQPVFSAIVEGAVRLCGALFGVVWRYDGELLHCAASHNFTADVLDQIYKTYPKPPDRSLAAGRGILDGRITHVPDMLADREYAHEFALAGNWRATLSVPMLHKGNAVGAIAIGKAEVGPFSERQIQLLSTFAAQAVIAIENTRLLNELRESLDRQTAAAHVLGVISKSPGDLEPVFHSILQNATKLCEAKFGGLFLYEASGFRCVAHEGASTEHTERWRREPFLDLRDAPPALPLPRIAATKAIVHNLDIAAEVGPHERVFEKRHPLVGSSGARTVLGVPMLKDGALIGAIIIYRTEVRPFTDKQIALVQNFAAQAVIAIENARLLNELRERTADLSESLEQQTATSEVLRVISSSPGDLEPVFQSMLENAVRICEAKFGTLFRFDGNLLHLAAQFGTPHELVEMQRRRGPFQPVPGGKFDHVLRTKQVIRTADYSAEAVPGPSVRLGGARSTVHVPMLKDDVLIGAIIIYRQEVRPFTDKQIALVQNFAAQAVIAIENTRLLNELRQRTTDLTESLEQQTATSEVLRVISASPGELEPVFQAMLANATRICEAKFGILMLRQGDGFRSVAINGAPSAYTEAMGQNPYIPPRPGSGLVVLAQTKRPVQMADLQSEPGYIGNRLTTLAGARTLLIVPLLKDDELVGAINIYRQEVRPFTEKQIELVQNFGAQAVIAIENTRLLNELRQSLEQQTATANVLRIISSSPGELEPVFQAMLANATRICEAKFGILYRCEGDALRTVAMHDAPQPFVEVRRSNPMIRPNPYTTLGRAMTTKQPVQIANILEELDPLDDRAAQLPKLADARTVLAVPMLKENELLGAFLIYRTEVRPFSEKQIGLVQSFAAQAVIAIENTRLLNELKQSLEQQTATAEVLRVISSSPGALDPVFQAMLENAVRICEAKFGILWRYDNEAFEPVALFGAPEALAEFVRQRGRFQPSAGTALDLILRTKDIVRIDDAMKEPALGTARRGGARSLIIVPMLKDNALIGAITIYRQEVKPFTNKQVELIKNFAAQAVIAIENARLLKELRERTNQLEEQSQEVVNLNQQLEQRVVDQVGEIERMGRLRRFLPPQVADLIVASGTEKQLESHRREITALFCDLRGFTGFSESSDPEDVMALLREYHAAIGKIIIKYNGTLERFAGDGVMVIFNDPVPVENPALQAVLMALDMRLAIGGLIEKWRDIGHDLGFGIGIAHGFATLGTIGFEGRRDYAAVGTVSNIASRLCDEAKPGQILISPRVRQAVEKAVVIEPVGEFTLKGIRRPMLSYNVLESLPSEGN